jgi:hypothetical protein
MKMRVISSRSEITDLLPNEKIVHLAFRPSNTDLLDLIRKCPKLRALQVPPSYQKTMSTAFKGFLDMQGIELLEGDIWGHRKDLDEYFTVRDETVKEIKSLFQKGMGLDDIEKEIQKTTRLGPDLIKYVVKISA